MAKKFPSIWGDLTVGHVTPKDDTQGEPAKGVESTSTEDGAEAGEEAVVDNTATETEETSTEDSSGGAAAEPSTAPTAGESAAVEYDEELIETAYNLLIDEGVLPEPEEGDEFDVSPAGLADGVAAAVRKNVEKEIAAIPESVQQFYAHVMSGEDPASFKVNTPIVWDELNLEEEGNKEAALMQFYVNQGMTQEDAQEEIEDVIAAGKLDKKAEVARESLVKIQTANKQARAEAEAKAAAKAEKEANAEIAKINKTIDTADSIAGFKLDDKKRKAFKAYLFDKKPRTGKTQMQENMSSEDRRMNIAFLDFIDYNKKDLEKEIKTDLTRTRRKKLTRFKDKGVSSTNSSKSVTTKTNSKKGKLVIPSIFGAQSMEVED